jgi:hypothetical protein
VSETFNPIRRATTLMTNGGFCKVKRRNRQEDKLGARSATLFVPDDSAVERYRNVVSRQGVASGTKHGTAYSLQVSTVREAICLHCGCGLRNARQGRIYTRDY